MQLAEKKPTAVLAEEERKRAETEKESAQLPKPTTSGCDCGDREYDQSTREIEVSSSIAFEDALHNYVYVKRINTRQKRDVKEFLSFFERSMSTAKQKRETRTDLPVSRTLFVELRK